ncbi:phosphoenolpyruvate carboxykinase (GTP) [Candidatus Margulisiibacteriota bacterium]
MKIAEKVLSKENIKKLEALNNPKVMEVVEKYVELLQPDKVTVFTDSQGDVDKVRALALEKGEEKKLATKGHTVHWDGYNDQARDKNNTRVLVTPDMKMSKVIATKDREEGLKDVQEIMSGIMKGKEAFVRFFCLGPLDSKFSLLALQITDSAYVAHSEDILYRTGYEQFKKMKVKDEFFYFIHSAGEQDERGNSKNIDKRRIYMDVKENRVFTMNNQYAGNSLGLKKLALRLAIHKANHGDWLTEHMFILGAKSLLDNKRTTYFTGAFPSACGKTSTAMIPGQTIVGDDIAYIRTNEKGIPHAVNIEQGIFGIITDVNPVDDPIIYKTITTPRELIFSNILVKGTMPYWLNMGKDLPNEGENFTGQWKLGNKDAKGKEIPHAHKNARYTVRIEELENADPKINDPEGVPISGVIYGGRDSDTSVPVFQSFSWDHGVFIGATIESETTAATLGAEGVRKFSPMSNLDFLVVPLDKYIQNHIDFGAKLKKTPLVFATNYFIKKDGKFLSEKVDKKVWLMWMEGRVHGEYDAIETPIGFIPKYEDLKALFKKIFDRDYTENDYKEQFTIRTEKWLEKIDRINKFFSDEDNIPEAMWQELEGLKKRLAK